MNFKVLLNYNTTLKFKAVYSVITSIGYIHEEKKILCHSFLGLLKRIRNIYRTIIYTHT